MSFRCVKSGLPFVAFANANVVVSRPDIELGEQRVSLEFFGDVLDVRYWVLVPNCPVVDGPVVLYWAIGSVLFLDAEGACGVWGF